MWRGALAVATIVSLNEGAARRVKVSVKSSSDKIDYRADH